MFVRQLGLIAATAALLFSAESALAFTVDGRVGSDDNYTVAYDLDFYVWNTDNGNGGNQRVEGGKLRIGRDGPAGDMYMMVEVPTSIVDNVYGAAAATPGSGWTQSQPFNNLRYSDSFEFKVNTIYGEKVIDVDYINGQTLQAGIKRNDYGVLIDVATSLEYNLAQGYGDTTNSPDPIAGNPPSGWIQTVQYEFQMKGHKFTSGSMIGLADLSWAWLHASPNKLKGHSEIKLKCLYYNSCDISTEIPEDPPVAIAAPGAGLIFAIAVGALGFSRRRKTAVSAR